MEKAYDLGELGKLLAADGLPLLEVEAEKVYANVKKWIEQSADLSPNPYDNFIKLSFGELDKLVLPALDKIDGQAG